MTGIVPGSHTGAKWIGAAAAHASHETALLVTCWRLGAGRPVPQDPRRKTYLRVQSDARGGMPARIACRVGGEGSGMNARLAHLG